MSKTLEKTAYAIGKDPNRHYVFVELDSKFWETNLEEYLDRPSPLASEEGQPMYRVEADPREDSDLRRYTGSSKRVMLSCSKEASAAWEKQWADRATAVLRPKNDARESSFTRFVDATGQPLEADSGLVLGSGSIL